MARRGARRPPSIPRILAAASALATVAAAPAVSPPSLAQDPAQEIGRLERENDLLRKELDLANGDRFYLVLDPAASTLRLMLKGAVLQEYAIQKLEAGSPRVAFVTREPPAEWRGRVWNGGALSPPRERDRFELIAPPPSENPDSEPAVPIPPTPEEAYPVPHRYHVRYDGGLSLEIRRLGDVEAAAGWWAGLKRRLRAWWDDAVAAIGRSSPDADELRLRVTLRSKDADSLYRALPPDTKLLVIPSV